MRSKYRWTAILLVFVFLSFKASALVMKGKVYDGESKKALSGVNIINTQTQMVFQTDSTGLFTINVQPGQLIEFKIMGYQTARVRINGNSLPYYSIGLLKAAYVIPEIKVQDHSFQADSIENQETYKWALDHYTLNGLDAVSHPFDALSKQNRQIWAFQKRFHYFEQQKFIDYVFNDKLIQNITGLNGDYLQDYKRLYRPPYELIQKWTTYEFYDYIKQTGNRYKALHKIPN